MNPNYRKLGPGTQACKLCNTRLSTNALARAAHERSQKHIDAANEAAADSILAKATQPINR